MNVCVNTRRTVSAWRWLSRLSALAMVAFGMVTPHAGADEASAAPSASAIEILPSEIQLVGLQARQQLLAERRQNGHAVGPAVDVEWKSTNPDVVRIENGVAVPVSDGVAVVQARSNSGTDEISIRVRQTAEPSAWEFRRHVIPVLSRLGCNTGACHGALAGKGGFRLSLRGYHPEGDFQTITREARGRRVELADPEGSLLLTKPTMTVPHQGGLRLDSQSPEYALLAEWIRQGAAGPSDKDASVVRLQVFPDAMRLKPGDRQPLLVSAIYSDGTVEDVTAWAKFSSSDETVAKVDEHGSIHVLSSGDSSIVVWFSSRIELSRVTVPFEHSVPEASYDRFQSANFIDHQVKERLRELQLEPSNRCSDHEFIRRVYLDTIGRLPTMAEWRRWNDRAETNKRALLIDELLAREEFVDYWTYRLSDLLLINGRRLRPAAVDAYYDWLRTQVTNDVPWDQLVRQILTAKGGHAENGATNFYALHQDPESMTENACQAFLGLSIGCAKCHNHPLEKWTNHQYYAMASFFARVKAKGWGGDPRNGDGVRTLLVAKQGELIQPLTGRPQPPTPLDGDPLSLDFSGDRREYLADWMVSSQNPYFSRAISNRVWAQFFGRGIVEPVDDMRVSNPARNEPLLQALSQFLVDHEFDLKSLMREILRSETYQRSSVPTSGNVEDQYFFSRYYPRRLPAEVLLDAIAQVTEVPSQFNQIGFDGNDFQAISNYPLGTRAVELKDSAVVSNFLQTFGRPERDITCECERSNTPSMVQVLHIHNGTTINERLKAKGSCLDRWLRESRDDRDLIREAFVTALSREPTDQELNGLAAEMATEDPAERRTRWEDLYWGLMSSREFLFNH